VAAFFFYISGSWTGRICRDTIENRQRKGGCAMTEELIHELKHVKNALVNKEMQGEAWEEKQEMIRKLEDVTSYLKDALGQGIEF
jgi:hypothetical protein